MRLLALLLALALALAGCAPIGPVPRTLPDGPLCAYAPLPQCPR